MHGSGDERSEFKEVGDVTRREKLHLPTQREAEELTGLQSGGISPLALLNKGFQLCLDQSAEAHKEIHISGGQRGLNIRLGVKDLITVTNARIVEAISILIPS